MFCIRYNLSSTFLDIKESFSKLKNYTSSISVIRTVFEMCILCAQRRPVAGRDKKVHVSNRIM